MAYVRETTVGGSIVKPSNPNQRYLGLTPSKKERRMFDAGDIVRNQGETGGLFIVTKVSITEKQTIKQCNVLPCTRDSECPISEPPFREHKCVSETGFCKEIDWCPINMDSNSTKTYIIQNLTQDTQIDFFNVIQFGTDMNEEDKLYITHKRPNQTILYPEVNANAFNLTYILKDTN